VTRRRLSRAVLLSACVVGFAPASVAAQAGGSTAPRPQPAPRRPAGPPRLAKFFLAAGVGVAATSNDFDQSVPFTLFAEEASIDGRVAVGRGPYLDARAGYRVWRRLGVGAGVSHFQWTGSQHVIFRLPHPFLRAMPQVAEGDADARRALTEVDVSVLFGLSAGPRWHLVAYGGPTVAFLSQELGHDRFLYRYVFPFTEIVLEPRSGGASTGRGIGAHGGLAMTRLLGRRWGLHFDIRGSTADAELDEFDAPFVISTAVLRVTAGLRVHF
jgi:hypothetical protein